MRPRTLRIARGGRSKSFLVLAREISVGTGPGNDFVVCHPGLPPDGVRLGGIVGALSDGPGGRRPCQDGQGASSCLGLGDLTLRVDAIPWKAVVPAILAIGLVVCLMLLAFGERGTTQDWTPIPLPAEGPFGLCRQDGSHPEGVLLSLPEDAAGGDVLEFVPGGGGDGRTLRLTVDGRVLRDGITFSPGWGEAVRIALPADATLAEWRLVEVRPMPPADPVRPWGIRDIRILPGSRLPTTDPAARDAAESVLADPLAGGPDLAASYIRLSRVVDQGARKEPSAEAALLRRLEDRMTAVLVGQLRRARAMALSGMDDEARRTRQSLSNWVPHQWIEGREVLGGFEF